MRTIWPTPEEEVLLQAALLPDDRALAAWERVRPTIDVPTMDGALTALLPMLRRNLIARGIEDDLLELFKGVQRYSWARTQLLLAPLVPVVGALEGAGIPTVLLKGGAFVADTRVEGGLRSMNDLDVLVPTNRTADAVEVLVANGLQPVDGLAPWYVVDHVPRYSPGYAFRDGDDRQLDLHWNVLHASRQPDADAEFWAASVPVELLGVQSRTLCPADELLHVVLHGLRWSEHPSFRWVIDAALIAAGTFGPVDYDRLVAQARRRRVSQSLRTGLLYLVDVAAADIPADVLRGLRRRRAVLERIEATTQATRPQARGRAARRLLAHEHHLRQQLPLGARAGAGARARLELDRLGIAGVRDLRRVGDGLPGPGRPASESCAAVGPRVPGPPVRLGEPLDFRRDDVVRAHVAHGTWRNEPGGAWTAGTETRLVVPLAPHAARLLVLELRTVPFLAGRLKRQRLQVHVNGSAVADLSADGPVDLVLPFPAEGARELEIVLVAPDAASQLELGVGDDDRTLGFMLSTLTVREPGGCRPGERVTFGAGRDDDAYLAGGWYWPESAGRWTRGTSSVVVARLADPPAAVDLVVEALPFVGRPGRTQLVDVVAGGRAAGTLAYHDVADNGRVVSLRRDDFGPDGEIVLELRTRSPRSPCDEGTGEDERPLGLCLAALTFQPADASR